MSSCQHGGLVGGQVGSWQSVAMFFFFKYCMFEFEFVSHLIKPVEGSSFLHEARQVLLPVKLIGLSHGCLHLSREREGEKGEKEERERGGREWE